MSRIAKAAGVALGAGAVVISGAGLALADSDAQGAAIGSPGVISGNTVQVPLDVPVNLCGNTIDIIGLLNPAFGNTCVVKSDREKHHGGDSGHGGYSGHGDKGHGDKGHGGHGGDSGHGR
ncbi:chaplin [Streptomyces minutiscleroticus]|uniref:Chaplin domain-containing protein n=1 Tax=Streptomyces minutiscleroticus TaxID=68238 RepID=A0A918P333_9ACTN|nr:chaplin [Streptomyces minutiscleroticus]GGY17089.1 hypothetical protein GCM10010358_80860 [Streptomyces minutiscleroticus]